ncbi:MULTISPECIES: hypothetical protein [unclassified Streptomyces]|uniref:hypothetical protein n=1 Tax=unclassified Streptomyces TaxID=2593676 RepID=UPI00081EED15|nr:MULTISPECIES: hypothetical protein [unclassified Streptomyces]MYZ38657.1 hypothetical protein [Streptomyces sp. SID4917]SCF99692.1 hypothetical protein GA0115259_106734 [Streptomyces sp. MnatMP-M17]
MRIRTALAATALAAAALLGGAGSALACEGHDDATVAAGGFHKEGAAGYYHNLGGPAGITEGAHSSHKAGGWFGFLDI